MRVDDAPQEQFYAAVTREILPRLEALAQCRSTAEMEVHPAYRAIAPLVAWSLATPHIADFRRQEAPLCPRYRLLAWNIERGTQFEAQLEAFRSHPYLKACDVLLITEADAGMARSGNRMVAEVLARELGMVQVFAPCYIALGKGSGVERHVGGDNTLGLHGNALLSRYLMREIRLTPLDNGVTRWLIARSASAARLPSPPVSTSRISRSTPFPCTSAPSPPSGIAFQNLDHAVDRVSLADAAGIHLHAAAVEPDDVSGRVEMHMPVAHAIQSGGNFRGRWQVAGTSEESPNPHERANRNVEGPGALAAVFQTGCQQVEQLRGNLERPGAGLMVHAAPFAIRLVI